MSHISTTDSAHDHIVAFLWLGAVISVTIVLSAVIHFCYGICNCNQRGRYNTSGKPNAPLLTKPPTIRTEQPVHESTTEEAQKVKHHLIKDDTFEHKSTEPSPIKSVYTINRNHQTPRNPRRSKSDIIESRIPRIKITDDHRMEHEWAQESNTHHRRNTTQITRLTRRFRGIANYYNKTRNSNPQTPVHEKEDSSNGDSVSPMSVIRYLSDAESDHFDIKFDETSLLPSPSKRRRSRHLSIFENIMANNTVLDGIRMGKLHEVIHECTANDIANFFPIIAAIICKIPYGMKNEQDKLLQSIRDRAVHNPGLRQTIQFFMLSNQDSILVRQIWRYSAFMIALESSHGIDVSVDDHKVIPHNHSPLKRRKSSSRRVSIDMELETLNPNTPVKQHRKRKSCTTDDLCVVNAGVQSFNDNVDAFRWIFGCPVGTTMTNPQICDPINDNQQIDELKVAKIFESAARPVLIATNNGSFILKEGDDLRQDENMMFMFHVMNAIWEEHGLEYKNNPIRALTYLLKPMGVDFGAIELVEGCVPLRNILTMKDTFEEHQHLFNNLIASTVGSYIATYVLGVGDRHFDNILIREDGTLFHIDFGYILGHKVSMDTAEFAITTDLFTIITAQKEEMWQQFMDICVDAFMILRTHCEELIQFADIAFTFLQSPTPIDEFFHQIFATHLSEKEVEISLRNKLEQAPFDWNTKIKNAMHSLATTSWYPK
eukprot:264804_1